MIDFAIYSITVIAIWSVLALSLNLQFGMTGLVNFGQILPFAIGSYAAGIGASLGYPWWAGALAGLAIMTRTEMLVVLLGGLFVIITMSVVLQVGFFKLTHGKRLFKMAPLQHHFEMLGWAEVTIVIRFWIICGIVVALGLSLFYAEWVVGQ